MLTQRLADRILALASCCNRDSIALAVSRNAAYADLVKASDRIGQSARGRTAACKYDSQVLGRKRIAPTKRQGGTGQAEVRRDAQPAVSDGKALKCRAPARGVLGRTSTAVLHEGCDQHHAACRLRERREALVHLPRLDADPATGVAEL